MDAICFTDQAFLATTPLTPDNILDYFARSPFYDPSCNNEVIKMQNQYRGISSHEGFEKLKGMYYKLEYCGESLTLFIIRQSINKGDEHLNINFYYVMYGNVYKAPTEQMVYKTRINDIFWYLNTILDSYIDNVFFKSDDNKEEIDTVNELPEYVRKDIYDEFLK